MQYTIEKIIKQAEDLGWTVKKTEDNTYELSKYSPAGQDFSIRIEAKNHKELADNLYDCYQNYDPSEEAYLWLDEEGHGKNGAPYDMKAVYEDMEKCKQDILKLYYHIIYE